MPHATAGGMTAAASAVARLKIVLRCLRWCVLLLRSRVFACLGISADSLPCTIPSSNTSSSSSDPSSEYSWWELGILLLRSVLNPLSDSL